MTLVKNENYWDADSINMDEMDFKFNVTGDTGVDMMLADELDFVPNGSAMKQQTLTDAGFESSNVSYLLSLPEYQPCRKDRGNRIIPWQCKL